MKNRPGTRNIKGIMTGPRRISTTYNIHNIHNTTHTTTKVHTIANSEIDNHADTTCFGSNFTAIEFTGEQCEVAPFSSEYTTMDNIPVATAATAWDDPTTGETIILLFHQGLWFGDKLPNSLINPNQCRMHGVEICNAPLTGIGHWGSVMHKRILRFQWNLETALCPLGHGHHPSTKSGTIKSLR